MHCVLNDLKGALDVNNRLLKIDPKLLHNITSSSFGAIPAGDALGNLQCKRKKPALIYHSLTLTVLKAAAYLDI